MLQQDVKLLHVVWGLTDLMVEFRIELHDALVLHRLPVRRVHREGEDALAHGAADLLLGLVMLVIVIK